MHRKYFAIFLLDVLPTVPPVTPCPAIIESGGHVPPVSHGVGAFVLNTFTLATDAEKRLQR